MAARRRLVDRLQVHRFHLLDISWDLAIPPFALNPVASFSAITAPEISVETEEVTEGNSYFKRHVVTGGAVGSITMSRGASFYDSEFWLWVAATIQGQRGGIWKPLGPALRGGRRNLLLLQLMGYNYAGLAGTDPATADLLNALLPAPLMNVPAKAWMLIDCLPTRYKAGSDFDASSGEVSIMELEVMPERIEELGISA